jgi:uncharacterized membrane protein
VDLDKAREWNETRTLEQNMKNAKSPVFVGRSLLGLATLGSGVLQLVTGDFVRLVPKLPAWVPVPPMVLTYPTGLVLVAIGLAILSGRMMRPALVLLVAMILLDLVLVYAPQMVSSPEMDRPYLRGFMWTNPLKALALIGGAAMLTALGGEPRPSATLVRATAKLAPLGPTLLAAFLFVCGTQHFVYRDFVTTLVPAWIPAREFWTCFTGVALMAGGAGILVPRIARLAASLSALMIFLWVLLLHIPRALAGPHHANETAGVFEALALGGVALLVAGARAPRSH